MGEVSSMVNDTVVRCEGCGCLWEMSVTDNITATLHECPICSDRGEGDGNKEGT